MRTVCVLALVLEGCLVGACSSSSSPSSPAAVASGIDLTTIDRSARPQDDLFLHANGGWLAKTEIPADKASWGSFDMLFDKSQNDLRVLTEEIVQAADRAPGSDAQKVGDFYQSFLDEARVESLGATPLASELAVI